MAWHGFFTIFFSMDLAEKKEIMKLYGCSTTFYMLPFPRNVRNILSSIAKLTVRNKLTHICTYCTNGLQRVHGF